MSRSQDVTTNKISSTVLGRWKSVYFCIFILFKGMNKVIDSELLEYSVHAGVQTTLQVCMSQYLS